MGVRSTSSRETLSLSQENLVWNPLRQGRKGAWGSLNLTL